MNHPGDEMRPLGANHELKEGPEVADVVIRILLVGRKDHEGGIR